MVPGQLPAVRLPDAKHPAYPGLHHISGRGRRRLYLSLPCHASRAASEFPNQGQSGWPWTWRSELPGKGDSAGGLGLTSCFTWVGSALRLHDAALKLARRECAALPWTEGVRDSGVARERSFLEGTAADLRRDFRGERKRMKLLIKRHPRIYVANKALTIIFRTFVK